MQMVVTCYLFPLILIELYTAYFLHVYAAKSQIESRREDPGFYSLIFGGASPRQRPAPLLPAITLKIAGPRPSLGRRKRNLGPSLGEDHKE